MQLIVNRDSDDVAIGKIEAQVGMCLANNYQIIKVNSKSVIARNREEIEEKFTPPVSIYYTEAKRWGFISSEVNKYTENLAASERKFKYGELAHQRFADSAYSLPLNDATEYAGYEFARKTHEMRSREIQQLAKQEALRDLQLNKQKLLDRARDFGGEARANYRGGFIKKSDRDDLASAAGLSQWGDFPEEIGRELIAAFAEGYRSESKHYV